MNRGVVSTHAAVEAEWVSHNNGSNLTNYSEYYENWDESEEEECPVCYGTGLDRDEMYECPACYGEGYLSFLSPGS